MSKFFEEVLLKQEYEHILKFQDFGNIPQYIKVYYFDRISGNKQDIHILPKGNYPYKFEVIYSIPVYESRGRLRNDFNGTAIITVTEDVLINRDNNLPPSVDFRANIIPFNNHVNNTRICIGNAWSVAKNNGIWHFILCLGGLINQDHFVTDGDYANHFNPEAFDYWVERGKKPVNNIKFPLNLLTLMEEEDRIEVSKIPIKPITIIPKSTGIELPQSENSEKIINIVKKNNSTPKINILRKE